MDTQLDCERECGAGMGREEQGKRRENGRLTSIV